ncbi:MAG: hypothetical protein NT136_00450 [Candidatus Moranbacteria bacterium]|nr:hypothetical protein [Candidatus Moranbacteria bacterium]
MQPTNKKVKGAAVVFVLVLASFFFAFNNVPRAQAGVWGEDIAAAVLKQTMEVIQREIEGAILGSLKMTALQMMNTQVGNLIGGTGMGNAMFITDWQQFLYTNPARNTEFYLNDFFTLTTGGRSSTSNYCPANYTWDAEGNECISNQSMCKNEGDSCSASSECCSNNCSFDQVTGAGECIGTGSGGGIGGGSATGSYFTYLENQARQATMGGGIPQVTLQEYTSDPSQMFAQGNWRAFSAFISNPANNPFGYSLMAQAEYQRKLEEERKKAEIQAIAYQGYLARTSGGMVITPGSTIKDIQSNVQDLGNKIIAGTTNPAELLGAIVMSTINRVITTTIRSGVGMVQTQINREIRNVDANMMNQVRNTMNQQGPGSLFKPRY